MKTNFTHNDTNTSYVSLHDCFATHIDTTNTTLTFTFDNGFWVTPEHDANTSNDISRTNLAKVDFIINEDEITIYTFKKNFFRRTERIELSLNELINLINNEKYRLEFLYEYKGFNATIFDCWLHFDKKPYHYECELRIPVNKTIYRWNSLNENAIW
ncbi:MAG: hypothetical protein E7557_01825 [Ruminococcaceae bacterium]|nr:hypothetical protein [Oscillospiraceae bacterium]